MARTRRNSRLPSLTGIRLFAALFVIGIHTSTSWFSNTAVNDAAGFGYLGVTLFFILSGYVLAWSRRSHGGAVAFYRARFARIWPLHLLTLLIALFFLPMPTSVIAPAHAAGSIANVLLLQAWSPHPAVYWGYNGVAWSLSCEAFFYLLFPWLNRWIGRLSRVGLRKLTLCLAAWMVVPVLVAHLGAHTWGQPDRGWFWLTYICPLYTLSQFTLGLLLVRLVDVRRIGPASWLGTAVVGIATAGIVATLCLLSSQPPSYDWVTLITMPFLALLVITAAASDLRRNGFSLLRWRPVVIGGECAFAIYLTHQLVWKRLFLWGTRIPGWPMTRHELLGVYLVVVVVAALVGHYVIERPVEAWLLRQFTRTRHVIAEPLPTQRRPAEAA